MSLITSNPSRTNSYIEIADLIASIYDRITLIDNSLSDMASALFFSETSFNNIEKNKLYNTINNQKTIIYNANINSRDIRDMVKKLQDYTFNTYGDINAFYSNNSILVKQTFATLSAEIGYSISAGNIET